ncbi:interferon-induced protein with tetratricopeptide repeats 2-like [Lampris incognitus]|uniref:interferon-induced protein with tetratricopeptide repeats 2-like n=1 Tax=Lampris incognitus TaxID=2546036 RepID=UPI0024B55D52|nr:interferon-induced protein with tetratricopeptide repeats 2-like [Lampris incognitus]
MMSAAQSQEILRTNLEALECHFTWELDNSRSKLLLLKDKLEDIGTEEGYLWLGHIYNLLAYTHYQLGSQEDAFKYFSKAAEAFCQIRNTVSDDGPWLMVNYGNLAWLYHKLGEEEKSKDYVAKVEALLKQHPSLSPGEHHPEVYAEKAWTLMNFSQHRKMQAVEYFEKAIRMDPDRVEWQTSHVLNLENALECRTSKQEAEILKKLKIAREHDPDNLYLAAIYLGTLAKTGRNIEYEARELAEQVLRKPVSIYSGIRPLLRLYRMYLSLDEAIGLADEALDRHPNERLLKYCLATCYKWKIFSDGDQLLRPCLLDRAISLQHEVISLYPFSSLQTKIALANLHVKSSHPDKASHIYKSLLESNLEPAEQQILYNNYAKYLHFNLHEYDSSIDYHMKAAEIPYPSRSRKNSINILRHISERRQQLRGKIEAFLVNLQE